MGITGKILIVDDEREALENCRRILSRVSYDCLVTADPADALDMIERERPGLVMTDLRMPKLDGIEVLAAAKRMDPAVLVVLLTAHATVDTAVTAMRYGAFDYITKPFTSDDLVQVARRAFESMPVSSVSTRPALTLERSSASLLEEAPLLVGNSVAMREVLTMINKVAPTDSNVLVYGESGTGKEMIARLIHESSLRAQCPFIPVDCVSLQDSLLETELFGHEKGAFTGAHVSKVGLFEAADGGTIFLDEVSGMSASLQARLLRVLQERHVRRVGGTRFTSLNVRVIAASNQNLEEQCRRGAFREDLYYRLNVIPLNLPPLRGRGGDILLLANEFLTRFAQQVRSDFGTIPTIDPSAADLLMRYAWPGNVRELQNVMERAAVLVEGPTVTSAHLPERDTLQQESTSFKQAKQQAVESFERGFLVDLLKRNDGHMGRAAREAGVDRKTIERMVKKHGLRGLF